MTLNFKWSDRRGFKFAPVQVTLWVERDALCAATAHLILADPATTVTRTSVERRLRSLVESHGGSFSDYPWEYVQPASGEGWVVEAASGHVSRLWPELDGDR